MQTTVRPVESVTPNIVVPVEEGELSGVLAIPEHSIGNVVFAHDSAVDYTNSRDRLLAQALNDYGVATLLIDLLMGKEEQHQYAARGGHFEVDLCGDRLVEAIDWMAAHPQLADRPIGILGASTGAGVALRAAAARPDRVAAVVCRGGRPELAGECLHAVTAPTLLIVGERDVPVLRINRQSAARLQGEHRVHVVQGATQLFEDAAKLDEVAQLARAWFLRHFGVQVH